MISSTDEPATAADCACGPIPDVSTLVPYTTAGEMAAVFQQNVARAIELKEQLEQQIAELNRVFGGPYFGSSVSICDADEPDQIRREAKRVGWKAIIGKLDIEKVMSSKTRQEMRDALSPSTRFSNSFGKRVRSRADDPINQFPEISPDAIRDVLSGYALSAQEFLDEAIQEEYEFLKPWQSDTYKTNAKNRWKLSRKVIIGYAVTQTCGRWRTQWNGRADHLQAIDRIFHLLDGRGFGEVDEHGRPIPGSFLGPLCSKIQEVQAANTPYETEYFRFRCFHNGNLHLEFKRMDLVQEFNYRCGNPFQLPGDDDGRFDRGKGADPDADDLPRPNGDFELFETPADLAAEMCDIAGITSGMTVLEPSAGRGRIARAARDCGATVRCMELQSDLASALNSDGFRTSCGDFLRTPDPDFWFDAVLMNPPFSRYQDIAHIRTAYDFLKPGGVLVSVASAGTRFRKDRRTTEFRQWLEKLGGDMDDLPTNTFKDEGTSVHTVLITVTKPV